MDHWEQPKTTQELWREHRQRRSQAIIPEKRKTLTKEELRRINFMKGQIQWWHDLAEENVKYLPWDLDRWEVRIQDLLLDIEIIQGPPEKKERVIVDLGNKEIVFLIVAFLFLALLFGG